MKRVSIIVLAVVFGCAIVSSGCITNIEGPVGPCGAVKCDGTGVCKTAVKCKGCPKCKAAATCKDPACKGCPKCKAAAACNDPACKGCPKCKAAYEAMRAGIAASNQAFVEAVRRGDAAGVTALYTSNGQLLPPGSPIIDRADIQQHWQNGFDGGMKDLKLTSVEVSGKKCGAYEIGKYIVYGANGEVTDTGKFLVIWKNVDGQWKLHRDIWNSDMAGP